MFAGERRRTRTPPRTKRANELTKQRRVPRFYFSRQASKLPSGSLLVPRSLSFFPSSFHPPPPPAVLPGEPTSKPGRFPGYPNRVPLPKYSRTSRETPGKFRHFYRAREPTLSPVRFSPFARDRRESSLLPGEEEFPWFVPPSKTAGKYNKYATRTLESSGITGIIIVFESGGD